MSRVVVSTVLTVLFSMSLQAQIRTWGFENGTRQGWSYVNIDGDPFPAGNLEESGVSWKVSKEDIALGENPDWFLLQGSTVDGPGVPGVNNHPDFFPEDLGTRSYNYRVIPEPWANRDCLGGLECQTQIFRSPTFKLGTGPISVDITGGQAQGGRAFDPNFDDTPVDAGDLDFIKGSTGYQGFALYDVDADEYVAWGYPSRNNDGKVRDNRETWETVTIPAGELTDFANDGKDYRIDVFDSHSGGWGWIGFDTVRVPDAEMADNVLLPGKEEWRVFKGMLPGRVEDVPVDANGLAWLDPNYDFDTITALTINDEVENWTWNRTMTPPISGLLTNQLLQTSRISTLMPML